MRTKSTTTKPRADGRKLLGFDCPVNEISDMAWSWHPEGRTRFHNAIQDWSGSVRTLRERKMIAFMDQISDKPDWTRKIHDEGIIAKWKAEAAARMAEPESALTENMIDYCIAEMRDYAKEYAKHGFTPAIRACATVFKSDTIVSSGFNQALRTAVASLEDVPEKHKDWHPGSDGKVLDPVHPSLFPLMYGKSRILDEGIVPLQDCEQFIGKGQIMPTPEEDHRHLERLPQYHNYGRKRYFYSDKFQWLPCEVAFTANDEVKITSYINNLHPKGNEKIYEAIEGIIARAVPMWDATLASTEFKRKSLVRIHISRPYYIEPEGERPHDPNEDSSDEDEQAELDYEWEHANRTVVMPEPGEYPSDQNQHSRKESDSISQDDDSGYKYPILGTGKKLFPAKKASVDQMFPSLQSADQLEAEAAQTALPPPQGLRQIFATQGLQVIVKLANIHLTPDKPTYDGGSWHIEGQLNEHIGASALYYYDNTNITPSSLSFRERTSSYDLDKCYDQSEYEHLELLYGIKNWEGATQEFHGVATRENRLLVFPNVLQHRVSPFALKDKTKPGHRKILALFLVDPYLRIPSTANVPPQQKEWWRSTLSDIERLGDLPTELVDRIVDEVEDFPISLEEAKKVRLELMEERKVFVEDVDQKFQENGFCFCEH